jgi:hypothetical protein
MSKAHERQQAKREEIMMDVQIVAIAEHDRDDGQRSDYDGESG